MEENRWGKVSEILLDCLEVEPLKRHAYLNSLELAAEMRSEVESLLTFEVGAANLMNISAVELSDGYFDDDDGVKTAVAGQNFGNYDVIREIGSGGMGAVFLAERSDGNFHQKVALKLLKREMNTASLRRRFQQERQILASLEHENIARLMDAGSTDDNVPFIAMEYVEGLPINEYCNRNNLDIVHRLDLFREICLAVDFAHRNLVVHRDLKPSNILVNESGTPKLLDFGISKFISEEIESADLATVTELGVMTPGYASPEQIQRKSVTTATDIYSLGVILFELLSGHRPFETKENDFKEIYKAIIETDPPLPSSMVTLAASEFQELREAKTALQIPDRPASVVEQGSNPFAQNILLDTRENKTPQTKRRTINISASEIRGDLDNIVLKALRKEPERRYSSAENFAEDVKNHLRGLPVTARPNTFSYRAEKFVTRNKVGVVASALILLAIITGIAATLWQARVAQIERAKAERRFNDVRNLANSFLFSLSPKIEKLPGSTAAREELVNLALEYLDSLAKEVGDDLDLQLELAAAYEKVGDVQGNPSNPNIGNIKGALESYEKASMIREALREKQPEDINFESGLAKNYKVLGEINSNIGTYAKGKEYLDKALEMRSAILERNPNDYAARAMLSEILTSRGDVEFYDSKNKEAIKFYDRSRQIYEQLLNERPSDYLMERLYANSFVNLGEAYGWDNDLKNGQMKLDKALIILQKLGNEHPNDQKVLRSLVLAYLKTADNYADSDKEGEGIELFGQGIEVAERLSNADPRSVQAKRDLAIITRKLAEVLNRVGKNKESLEKMIGVRRIFEELRDSDPNNALAIYDVANAQFAAGGTYLALKDYYGGIKTLEEAKQGFQEALRIDRDHTNAARTLAFTSINIATHYTKLATGQNRREYLQKALIYKREGIERLYQLKADGKLSEFDNKYIAEAESELKEIESKLIG